MLINVYIEPRLIKIFLVPAPGKRSPESIVPIFRDKKFVDRQDVFRALDFQFSQPNCHNRAVLTGLGGVGYICTYYTLYIARSD